MLSFPSLTNDPRRESLLLRRGNHPVELPLGRGALGPHGQELLLQDTLGGLELHLHQLGRGAELRLERCHPLVQALLGCGQMGSTLMGPLQK